MTIYFPSPGALKHLLRLVEPIGKLSTSILMLSVLTTLYRLTTHRHTYEMYFFQTVRLQNKKFVPLPLTDEYTQPTRYKTPFSTL